jgi:hypothetical protein
MKQNKKIEGYWYSEDEPQYPMPKENVLSEKEAEDIFQLILKKEAEANVERYKGSSKSRITGEYLGNAEYETDEWIWPADFAYHYVLQHKVKPSDEFLEYIGYKK